MIEDPHRHARSDSELHELGSHMAAALENARRMTNGRARARARFLSGEPVPARPAFGLRPAAAVLAVVAAAVVSMFVTRAAFAPKPALAITLDAASGRLPVDVGGLVVAPRDGEAPLAFTDGTRVTLKQGSRARVASVDASGARVLLEGGELHAHVAHVRDAKWIFDAGPFQVRVTGTRFDVKWDPATEALVVTLLEGSVNVRGCSLASTGQRVVAGQRLSASCKDSAISIGPASAPAQPALSFEVTVAPSADAKLPNVAPAVPPATASARAAVARPRAHDDGETAAVHAEVAMPALPDIADAIDLLKRAEEARFAGEVPQAKVLLVDLRARFPATEPATRAAFELGRITFDAERDYSNAAAWFEIVLKERPGIGFAREALGRALEAKAKAGDAEGTRRHAVRYLAVYPDGPHAAFARRVLLEGSSDGRTP